MPHHIPDCQERQNLARESTAALEAVLASSDEVARNQALDIINWLVEAGSLAACDIARRANLVKPAQ